MKNTIKYLIVACTIALVGCDPSYREVTQTYEMPPELSDCQVFNLNNGGGNIIKVVRCPNTSSVTTSEYKNKTTYSNTVIY